MRSGRIPKLQQKVPLGNDSQATGRVTSGKALELTRRNAAAQSIDLVQSPVIACGRMASQIPDLTERQRVMVTGDSISEGASMGSARLTPRRRQLQPDLRPQHRVLPLVFSIVAHVTLLLVVASGMRWFQQGQFGIGNDATSGFGLTLEGGTGGGGGGTELPGDPTGGSTIGTAVEAAPATDQFTPKQATSERPPAEISIPVADTIPQNGAGRVVSAAATGGAGSTIGDPRSAVKSQGGKYQGGKGNGTGGGNGTGLGGSGGRGSLFLGIRDDGGMKVVYVIDASGSMTSYNAMQFAKNNLQSSLQGLDEQQQFLIIFYDDKPHVLRLHDEPKPTLVAATELNKTLARQKDLKFSLGSNT